jgi:putative FmdB family regulatory protein
MPMYDFRCTKCEHEFEEVIASSAAPPACPQCGQATEKLMSAPFIGDPMSKHSPKGRKLKEKLDRMSKDQKKKMAKDAGM